MREQCKQNHLDLYIIEFQLHRTSKRTWVKLASEVPSSRFFPLDLYSTLII